MSEQRSDPVYRGAETSSEQMARLAKDRIATLEAALLKLRNEVYGSLYMDEPEIRHIIGNTNFQCIELRLREADALLTSQSETDDAPEITEADLKRGKWRLGGKEVSEEEGKAAARAAFSKETDEKCTCKPVATNLPNLPIMKSHDKDCPTHGWKPLPEKTKGDDNAKG